MRMLNNNKGSLIVILVIAMTLIAVLGASFVYIVSTKQEGFTFLLNAQKANMVARGGVEWAIRFASYGEDTNNNSIFFSNPTLTFTKNIVYGASAEGAFSTNYDYGTGTLTVNGTYQGVTETISFYNFRSFLSPITLVPSSDTNLKAKYRSSDKHFLDVPVLVNCDVTVNRIDIMTDKANAYLRYITDPENVVIFNYRISYNNLTYPVCNFSTTNRPCHYEWWDWDESSYTYKWRSIGLLLNSTPSATQMTTPGITSNTLGFSMGNYVFEFYYEGTSGFHSIAFNPDGVKSEIKFRP